MSEQRDPSEIQAGGFPIAVGFVAGAVIGLMVNQPVIGFLAGGALGAVAATVMWWRDRR